METAKLAENVAFNILKQAVIYLPQDVKEALKKSYPVIDVDGARVKFEDGWGLVRASNTQPVLVRRLEALSESRRQEIRRHVQDNVRRAVENLRKQKE